MEARVFAWNPASMRVLEKAGFSRAGLHPRSITKDGQVIDSVMYGHVRGCLQATSLAAMRRTSWVAKASSMWQPAQS